MLKNKILWTSLLNSTGPFHYFPLKLSSKICLFLENVIYTSYLLSMAILKIRVKVKIFVCQKIQEFNYLHNVKTSNILIRPVVKSTMCWRQEDCMITSTCPRGRHVDSFSTVVNRSSAHHTQYSRSKTNNFNGFQSWNFKSKPQTSLCLRLGLDLTLDLLDSN